MPPRAHGGLLAKGKGKFAVDAQLVPHNCSALRGTPGDPFTTLKPFFNFHKMPADQALSDFHPCRELSRLSMRHWVVELTPISSSSWVRLTILSMLNLLYGGYRFLWISKDLIGPR